MSSLAKLDMYDYMVLPGVIRIKLSSTSDPILVDILSEINNCYDIIYIEGRYYNFLEDFDIFTDNEGSWLDLVVVEIRGDVMPDILNTNSARTE